MPMSLRGSILSAARMGTLLLVVLGVLTACADNAEQLLQAQKQNQQLHSQLQQAEQTIADKQATIDRREEQISTLSGLGPERLNLLFAVEKIKLGRYTGGANLDDKPGQDGIRVYIIPQDAQGRTVTAAGRIEVEIFDLAQKDEFLLASYAFGPAEAKKLWESGALANHYHISCPWKESLPSADEVTVRVKFVAYLTGQTFTATKQCRIVLPQP